MRDWLQSLSGGDRRSIGQSNRVVGAVLANRRKFSALIDGLKADDYLIVMRCADAAEQVSRVHPEWLQRYGSILLDLASKVTHQELRWHLAQMLPRLTLSASERRRAIALMEEYLVDKSRIMQAFALQALADFAAADTALRRRWLPRFEAIAHTGSPSSRARARKVIAALQRSHDTHSALSAPRATP